MAVTLPRKNRSSRDLNDHVLASATDQTKLWLSLSVKQH